MQNSYTLPPQGYLYEDTSVIEDVVASGKNVIIEARPGSGKSYGAIRKLRELEKQFVFVTDTTSLADDLSSSYGLPAYYKGQSLPSSEESYITIYDWVSRLPNEEGLCKEDLIVVVDEWHSIISQYGFRDKAIDPMTLAFEEFGQVIGLTGTNILEPAGYETVTIEQERAPIDVVHIEYESLWGAIVTGILDAPTAKHFVSLYNKKHAQTLAAHLENEGIAPGTIALFNSETKNSADMQRFMEKNAYPDGVEVIISTYEQGFSVKERCVRVHIALLPVARHWSEHIAQATQRFREPEELSVNLYRNFPSPNRSTHTDLERYHAHLKGEAERRIERYRDELGLSEGDEPSDLQREFVQHSEQEGLLLDAPDEEMLHLVRPDLRTNDLQIWYRLHEKRAQNAYESKAEMKRQLQQYGMYFVDQYYCPVVLSKSSGISPSNTSDAQFENRLNECLSQDWPQGNDEVACKVRFLASYFPRKYTRQLIQEWGRSTQKWNRLKRRIRIQSPVSEMDRAKSEAVYAAFDIGARYTSEEVRDTFNEICTQIAHTWPLPITKNKGGRLIQDYFEAERRRNASTGQQEYHLLSDNPFEHEVEQRSSDHRGGKYTFQASAGWTTG